MLSSSPSSAVPMQTALPSGTKRATASRMDMSRVSGTGPSYSGSAHDGILSAVILFSHVKRIICATSFVPIPGLIDPMLGHRRRPHRWILSLDGHLFVNVPALLNSATEMVHGIHLAFVGLGGLTNLSALVFRELRNDDGDAVSRLHILQDEG